MVSAFSGGVAALAGRPWRLSANVCGSVALPDLMHVPSRPCDVWCTGRRALVIDEVRLLSHRQCTALD